jgi:hypothetical protein
MPSKGSLLKTGRTVFGGFNGLFRAGDRRLDLGWRSATIRLYLSSRNDGH